MVTRKDSKGRKLKEGESERLDGRYSFRYTDIKDGKRKSIYASNLAELRIKEKQLQKDLEDSILSDTMIKKLTLNELFERYLKTKNLADTTRINYIKMWNNRVKNELGNCKVVHIKSSDVKIFYKKLSDEGYAYTTIKLLHNLIYPSLEMAVGDDIIRKNPSKKALKEDVGKEAKKKMILLPEQQDKLLDFISNSYVYNVHYYMITILLELMLRNGELLGLTWDDVDFDKREIIITHQLIYKDYGDGYKFHISKPKTKAGIRSLPMTENVYKAFKEQKKLNFMLGKRSSEVIDGYSNFIFLTKSGRPLMPSAVNDILYNIVDAYNKEEVSKSKKEKRKAELMPKFSVHVLRHTGCTNKARAQMNVKVLQYLMGHAHSDVTLDVYNHLDNITDVIYEVKRVEQEAINY